MTPERSHGHLPAWLAGLLASQGVHLLLGLLAVAVSIFAVVDATQQRPNDGTVWLLGRPEIVVLEAPTRPGSTPSLLRPDDRILGIANRLVRTPQEAASLLRRQHVGSPVEYLVRRDGQDIVVPVQLTGFRVADRFYAYNIVLALIYLAIGFAVYARSLNDQPARLFFMLCLLFSIFFVTNLNRSSYFWGDIITQNAGAFARFLLPALFLHFFLVFPDKKLTLTRYSYAEPLLYLLPVMFYVRFTLDQFFGSRAPRIGTVQWLALGICFSLGLIALLHSYMSYRDPLQKQRVRILTIGTIAGVLPFLVFKVGLEEMTANSELAWLGIAPLAALPASFGYCIARYRIMQVEVMLKRSLIYTVLTAVVVTAYFALALGMGVLFARLSGLTSQLVMVGATLGIAAVLWPVRSRTQDLLDRRFFRNRTHLASVLQEFSREIPRLIQREALLERVGSRLCRILDLPGLAVYLREERAGATAWALAGRTETGETTAAPVPTAPEFPPQLELNATITRLERFNEPFWIERPGTDPRALGPAVTREQEELAQRLAEQESLDRAGIALLVPLASQGRLVGLFALPHKHSDDAFHVQDLDLLTIVAGQVALQVENSRLYEEEIEKQKLDEQLALARSIQSRLLPSRLPTVPGVELSAVNISSAQVSGDYYDLIVRPDGQLGLVVSDVSGKGIPASLLASSLQAALRAHCDNSDSPGHILQRVNKHLHASTDPQHFATLFLGFYDPRTRRLRYSSGGHNPPILRRAAGAIELCEEGGLPLGAFDFGEYAEGETQLDAGDVLLLYTDGLTEACDAAGEEFGTAGVERVLHLCHGCSAGELVRTLGSELQRFCGRRETDDDVTMLVLKVGGQATTLDSEGAAAAAARGE